MFAIFEEAFVYMYISKIQLAAAMADKNLNFKNLAIACGVSRATISYINNGKTCTPNFVGKNCENS